MYLLNAKANNNLQGFKAAINALETGLDYLFDNAELEKEFYEHFSEAIKRHNPNILLNDVELFVAVLLYKIHILTIQI
mgnify:CR=1 FL=1